MYVRFVVGAAAEDANSLTGVITMARILRDEGQVHEYEAAVLNEAFAWFNEHLPCPPFKEKLRTGEWTRDAVSWFRAESKEAIGRLWDIVAVLKEHGVQVRILTTEKPGTIDYKDKYQVVAETPW